MEVLNTGITVTYPSLTFTLSFESYNHLSAFIKVQSRVDDQFDSLGHTETLLTTGEKDSISFRKEFRIVYYVGIDQKQFLLFQIMDGDSMQVAQGYSMCSLELKISDIIYPINRFPVVLSGGDCIGHLVIHTRVSTEKQVVDFKNPISSQFFRSRPPTMEQIRLFTPSFTSASDYYIVSIKFKEMLAAKQSGISAFARLVVCFSTTTQTAYDLHVLKKSRTTMAAPYDVTFLDLHLTLEDITGSDDLTAEPRDDSFLVAQVYIENDVPGEKPTLHSYFPFHIPDLIASLQKAPKKDDSKTRYKKKPVVFGGNALRLAGEGALVGPRKQWKRDEGGEGAGTAAGTGAGEETGKRIFGSKSKTLVKADSLDDLMDAVSRPGKTTLEPNCNNRESDEEEDLGLLGIENSSGGSKFRLAKEEKFPYGKVKLTIQHTSSKTVVKIGDPSYEIKVQDILETAQETWHKRMLPLLNDACEQYSKECSHMYRLLKLTGEGWGSNITFLVDCHSACVQNMLHDNQPHKHPEAFSGSSVFDNMLNIHSLLSPYSRNGAVSAFAGGGVTFNPASVSSSSKGKKFHTHNTHLNHDNCKQQQVRNVGLPLCQELIWAETTDFIREQHSLAATAEMKSDHERTWLCGAFGSSPSCGLTYEEEEEVSHSPRGHKLSYNSDSSGCGSPTGKATRLTAGKKWGSVYDLSFENPNAETYQRTLKLRAKLNPKHKLERWMAAIGADTSPTGNGNWFHRELKYSDREALIRGFFEASVLYFPAPAQEALWAQYLDTERAKRAAQGYNPCMSFHDLHRISSSPSNSMTNLGSAAAGLTISVPSSPSSSFSSSFYESSVGRKSSPRSGGGSSPRVQGGNNSSPRAGGDQQAAVGASSTQSTIDAYTRVHNKTVSPATLRWSQRYSTQRMACYTGTGVSPDSTLKSYFSAIPSIHQKGATVEGPQNYDAAAIELLLYRQAHLANASSQDVNIVVWLMGRAPSAVDLEKTQQMLQRFLKRRLERTALVILIAQEAQFDLTDKMPEAMDQIAHSFDPFIDMIGKLKDKHEERGHMFPIFLVHSVSFAEVLALTFEYENSEFLADFARMKAEREKRRSGISNGKVRGSFTGGMSASLQKARASITGGKKHLEDDEDKSGDDENEQTGNSKRNDLPSVLSLMMVMERHKIFSAEATESIVARSDVSNELMRVSMMATIDEETKYKGSPRSQAGGGDRAMKRVSDFGLSVFSGLTGMFGGTEEENGAMMGGMEDETGGQNERGGGGEAHLDSDDEDNEETSWKYESSKRKGGRRDTKEGRIEAEDSCYNDWARESPRAYSSRMKASAAAGGEGEGRGGGRRRDNTSSLLPRTRSVTCGSAVNLAHPKPQINNTSDPLDDALFSRSSTGGAGAVNNRFRNEAHNGALSESLAMLLKQREEFKLNAQAAAATAAAKSKEQSKARRSPVINDADKVQGFRELTEIKGRFDAEVAQNVQQRVRIFVAQYTAYCAWRAAAAASERKERAATSAKDEEHVTAASAMTASHAYDDNNHESSDYAFLHAPTISRIAPSDKQKQGREKKRNKGGQGSDKSQVASKEKAAAAIPATDGGTDGACTIS